MKKSNSMMIIRDKNNSDNNNTRSDSSIFYIMDGIIDQLNKTKKLFIIMLLTIMIIPPIAFMLSFSLLGSPFPFDNRNERVMKSHGTPNQALLLDFCPYYL